MKSKWPKECPVFVIKDGYDHIRNGAVVEAFGDGAWRGDVWTSAQDGYLCVRCLDADDIVSDRVTVAKTYDVYGFFGCQVYIGDVVPLTPAAGEMLAVVRGGAK